MTEAANNVTRKLAKSPISSVESFQQAVKSVLKELKGYRRVMWGNIVSPSIRLRL